MGIKDQGAFPAMSPEAGGYSEGMTLRQYYAGLAMQASVGRGLPTDVAVTSVRYADALLAELAKEE